MQIHTGIEEVTLLCSVSEEAHVAIPGCPLGEDAFIEYEADLRKVNVLA